MKKDEQEILEALKRGDETVFNDFVRRYQKEVYMLALRLTGDKDEALDISQKVFIKAYKSIVNFRGESSISTWLYRITYNASLRYLNSLRVKKFFSFGKDDFEEFMGGDSNNDTSRNEFWENLHRALNKMPPQQKAVFTFRQIEGLKISETAEIMGLKEGTIKALHFHAVRKLREELKEWQYTNFS